MKQAINLSFLWCLIWGTIVAIILGLYRNWISLQFNSNPDIVRYTAIYLLVVPISYITYGIILISSSAYNASGKPLPSIIMAVTRMLILYIPLAYLGSWLFGVIGIFVAICLSNLMVGILAFIWTRKTFCTKV